MHTEASIIRDLNYRYPRQNVEYKLSRSFIFNWESDFFFITKSGYAVEVEVKISRADFKKDSEKKEKHQILKDGTYTKWVYGGYDRESRTHVKNSSEQTTNFRPNKFYYCTPKGLINVDQLPPYAGLMWLNDTGGIDIIKEAPYIHKEKLDFHKILCNKFYNKFMDIKQENEYLRSNTILKDV